MVTESRAVAQVGERGSGEPKARSSNPLHPPVGYDDNLVVNTLGNLDFRNVKVLEARIHGLGTDDDFSVEWIHPPLEKIRPVQGRAIAMPYVKNVRPSRLTSAAELLPNVDTLRELLPAHDVDALVETLRVEVSYE
ncbi:MAG: hypothetical protein OXB92_16025 [Acidimicrobiaceae bacterium]|nr:hypothetical protein [Acidimicrobiaceae bacterium]